LNIPVIEVRAWGNLVGALAPDPKLGYYAFAYHPSWRRLGIELTPLMMPVTDSRETFIFPNLPEATFRRLPAMFADALPDDFGNALIDAWMAEHGTAKSKVTALDRLAYMGKRGMGALEFKVVKKRVLSAAARARIGKATRKRWAEFRKKAKKLVG
jgi:serine/threonine-protein kinase HipA